MLQGLTLATATERSDFAANTIIISRGHPNSLINLIKIIYYLWSGAIGVSEGLRGLAGNKILGQRIDSQLKTKADIILREESFA